MEYRDTGHSNEVCDCGKRVYMRDYKKSKKVTRGFLCRKCKIQWIQERPKAWLEVREKEREEELEKRREKMKLNNE